MVKGSGWKEVDALRSAVETLRMSLDADRKLLLEELDWTPDVQRLAKPRAPFNSIYKSVEALFKALSAPEVEAFMKPILSSKIEYYIVWERVKKARDFIEEVGVAPHIRLHWVRYALTAVVLMIRNRDEHRS